MKWSQRRITGPTGVGAAHGTIASRCSTTSSMVSPLVSTTTASDVAWQRAVGARRVLPIAFDDRGLDLVDVAADLGDPPLGAHSRRRRDVELQRGVGEHDRADVAALRPPLPHARPPTPVGGARARRAHRLLAATALTAEVTSRPRISTVASTPSTVTPWSSTTRSSASDTSATSSSSDGSSPRRSAANVTARYIAPVSRYSSPSRSASARPTVLLPGPGGAVDGDHESAAFSAAGLTVGTRLTRTPRADGPRRIRPCSARRRRPARGTRRRWPLRRRCTTTAARRRSGR